MLQTLRRKQKYQVTNVAVEKIKLSRLLVQRINKFKINAETSLTSGRVRDFQAGKGVMVGLTRKIGRERNF